MSERRAQVVEWHEFTDRVQLMAWQLEKKCGHWPSHLFLNDLDWHRLNAEGLRSGILRIDRMPQAEIVTLFGMHVRRADETSVALMICDREEGDDDRTTA